MAKTNAEKQKEYRERKKLQSGSFLEKERKRQKKNYVKTAELTKKQLKERREKVNERVKRSRKATKMLTEIMNVSSSDTCDTDASVSPLLVSINFPGRGESSRKRKRSSDDKLRYKIAKLSHEKRRLELKCDSLRKKVGRKMKSKNQVTPNSKATKMLTAIGIDPEKAPEIKKQLLFAEAVSLEIQCAGKEKKNRKKSIRNILSGKILKKYKLLSYTASKTGLNRRKMSNITGKVVCEENQKRGFQPEIYAKVLEFYNRDDVSTALPGKRDAKKNKKKKIKIQKRVLNDYLSNLHDKFVTENEGVKCSFSTFARMRPPHFILANFSSRKTCLCTYHQNFALILKMLKTHINIPTQPETFIKFSDNQILTKIRDVEVEEFEFSVWKKVPVVYKGKQMMKMKIVTETLKHSEFCTRMIEDVQSFRSHVYQITCQFKEQRNIKENLPQNHVYMDMDPYGFC